MKAFPLSLLFLPAAVLPLRAQYSSHEQLAGRIERLGQRKDIITYTSLAATAGGRDIFLVRAGKGDADNKPAVAVIGGIDGTSPFSTELVMRMAEKLAAQNPRLFDEVTFYFLPNVSPDASEQYNSPLQYERTRNKVPWDADRDGLTDEDGYDDMNGDGMITRMRIHDPAAGDYIVHPANPSVMVKADITKGEKGEYLLLYEGFDNDRDGKINEDLPGGTVFNKNFSFHYPWFDEGAGTNALSEIETRAVAQFLFDHWNIFAVLCIGPENNLSEYNDLSAVLPDKQIAAAVSDSDKRVFESVVHTYRQRVHLPDSAKVTATGGDLLSWAWFHYNRFAFGTPAWNVARDKNNHGSAEFDYLKMAKDRNLPDPVIPWQKTEHPDFPGKTVEIGGLRPFARSQPPPGMADSVAGQHLDFLLDLAAMRPALAFHDVKITRNSHGVTLIEAEITNTGRFPTMPFLAQDSRWVKKIRLEIIPGQHQNLAGGRKVFLFGRIPSGESVKASWLVNGKGTVVLRAGSPQTGFIRKEVELN